MSRAQDVDVDDVPPTISALIGNIYEAGLEPARWSDVVSMVASAIGGSSSLIYGLATAAPHPGWSGHCFPSSAMQTYAEYYQSTNIWAHEIERRHIAVGVPVLTDALVDARSLEGSEFYTDYLKQLDIYRACTVLLHKDPRLATESHLCIYRSRSQDPFDNHSAELLRQLVPHLQRAGRIGSVVTQLKQQSEVGVAALDRMAAGILLFASNGTIVYLNSSAKAVVDASDGLMIVQDRLHAAMDQDTVWLNRLVSRAAHLGQKRVGGALQVFRPSGKRPLNLVVSPLPERGHSLVNGDSLATAMGVITGHELQLTDAHTLLSQFFELTPAETRVALGLLGGLSIKAIADEAATTVNTVKTQLASLFAKTGTHRQAEVTALLNAVCGHTFGYRHDFISKSPPSV